MKKKIIVTLLSVILAFSMSACNGKTDSNETSDKSNNSTESTEEDSAVSETERDFSEEDYSDTGEGTFSIQTSGGDSSDGSVPVLFVSSDDVLVQIGYLAENMDGSHLSFIYVDGMETAKEQLGEMSQGSIDLQDSFLEAGTHKVEVVQYDADATDGTIITYKTCSYEVKSK